MAAAPGWLTRRRPAVETSGYTAAASSLPGRWAAADQAARLSRRWPPDVAKRYRCRVSPTVFRRGGFRFYFFSREEPRIHVHVQHAEGEAKFWLEPEIELAQSWGLNARRTKAALALVRRHQQEIRDAWQAHFGR